MRLPDFFAKNVSHVFEPVHSPAQKNRAISAPASTAGKHRKTAMNRDSTAPALATTACASGCATSAPGPAALAAITGIVADDLAAVDLSISEQLRCDIALINDVSAHLIGGGGKRLRPLTLLLSARACGAAGGGDSVTLAAAIEFIHSATLLHDDVVDTSDLRRGNPTANRVWGNPASVLIGDFLYSRAVEMMASLGRMRVIGVMAGTTNTIAVGEVLQLQNSGRAAVSEARYFQTIHHKTAKLFESAALLGAVMADAPAATEHSLASYGRRLGVAFQLVDDVLDYAAPSAQTGKNHGNDLAEGKPTLPLIHALANGGRRERKLLTDAMAGRRRAPQLLGEVARVIESAGGFTYTARRAAEQAQQAKDALAGLAPSAAKDALLALADFAVTREY